MLSGKKGVAVMEKKVPVKSLKKALDLLSILLFEDREECGMEVKQLAGRVGLPANSVHNLLKTMRICGYVEKNGEGRYTFGPICRRIAYRNYQRGDDFREKVVGVMRGAIAKVNESMVFVILENHVWSTLVRAEPGGKIVKVDLEEVERCYLFETATGRVIYSYSNPSRRSVLIRENGHPAHSWPEYEEETLDIRRNGFCTLMRTRYGVFSFAVPVFAPSGELLGALGIYTMPTAALEQRKEFLIETLKEAAEEITLFLKEERKDFPETAGRAMDAAGEKEGLSL